LEDALHIRDRRRHITIKGFKMKITKRQLRRIIKEEKWKLLKENNDIIDGYYNAISQLIFDDMAAAGVDPHENPEEIGYAVAALQSLITDLQAGNY
jgi:hypothetical protein